jgi:hypothetical protein
VAAFIRIPPLFNSAKSDRLKIRAWALSAVVARFVHIEEVRGSIPLVPTVKLFFGQLKKTRKKVKEKWKR